VNDKDTFRAWASQALQHSVFTLELRAAVKAWHRDDWTGINDEVASFRTSRVQREASAQVGRSFLRSVASCYAGRARGLPEAEGVNDVQFPVAWGSAFRVLGLPATAMAETLVFGALRQWTQVAVRIVPLGQKDAFSVLTEVLATVVLPVPDLEEACRPLESLAPGLEMAGLGMETLERKYFRS